MPASTRPRNALIFAGIVLLIAGCDAGTSPSGDALTGARFSMTTLNGIPLPAALDNDTFPGTAHYTFVADTLAFDGHGTISDVEVDRLDYVGGTQPSIVSTTRGTMHYTLAGDAGTAIGDCPENAPCLPIQFSFSLLADTGLVLQAQSTHAVDTFHRLR